MQSFRLVALVAALAVGVTPLRSAVPQGPQQQEPQPPILRTGTRLVQVEVVVRGKTGPVTGLTRDDFTVLDRGDKQKIEVFSAGAGNPASAERKPAAPLPAGAVSNRVDRSGEAIAGATVVLFDQLNTSLDDQDYARSEIIKQVESARAGEKVAVYVLSKDLTVLQDFTDNPKSVARGIRKVPQNPLTMLIVSQENMDATDRANYDDHPAMRHAITAEAMAKIAQHLAGMPGRRSLIWISDTPGFAGMNALAMAGIHVYPVLTRLVGTSGVVTWLRDTKEQGTFRTPPGIAAGNELDKQRATAAFAASNGSSAFMDSRDIASAVHTTAEDAADAYTLGFYPPEASLDNKVHPLTVKLTGKAASRLGIDSKTLQIQYRPAYLATRAGPPVAPKASVGDILQNPLDLTAVGLTAKTAVIDGKYRVDFTVDLHDVHFTVQNARHVGAVALTIADEASGEAHTNVVQLSFDDAQLAAALQTGLSASQTFDRKSSMRIVAQDVATGAAGSLWLAPSEP